MNQQDTLNRLDVSVYRIPTDRPEADGTFHWDSTTMVLVEAVAASGLRGLGYTYTTGAAALVIHDLLAPVVVGIPTLENGRAWEAMIRAVRNAGLPGIAACAISGAIKAANLAYSHGIPFSTHTAPSIHVHLACAVPHIEHVEYFHDHVRVEGMLFDGALMPVKGCLYPDQTRPGLGLELRRVDAEQWRVEG